MGAGVLGACGVGLIWGAAAATLPVRRRWVANGGWVVGSTAAVVASVALATGHSSLAMVTAGAAVAGWLLRRALERLVEDLWT